MNGPGARPIDRILAGYNLALAGTWALLLGRAAYAPPILAAHLAAALMPALLVRAPARPSRPVRGLRELYPLIWVMAFWTELDFLRAHLHDAANDGPIAALDRALFGVHLSSEWMARMPQVWFSELMHLSYFGYYALILVPPVVLAVTGRRAALRDFVLRLTVAYLACYVVYIAFPVDGPHYLAARYHGPLNDGFFYRLVRLALDTGASRGASFPSSHVTGAVTIALIGWRWFRRPLAVLLTLEAIGVALSTVYTQNHYAVDSIAGVAWALGIQILLVPALVRGLRGTAPSRRPAPLRPSAPPALETTTGGGR